MIVVDVNVIVYALRREFPQHDVAHAWLGQQLVGAEGVVISDAVLAAAVRLLTHHKVLAAPMTPSQALAAVEAIRAAPAVVNPAARESRWRQFATLVDDLGLRANDIPDALLAATALSLGARLATFDRGFRRFAGLQVLEPSE